MSALRCPKTPPTLCCWSSFVAGFSIHRCCGFALKCIGNRGLITVDPMHGAHKEETPEEVRELARQYRLLQFYGKMEEKQAVRIQEG